MLPFFGAVNLEQVTGQVVQDVLELVELQKLVLRSTKESKREPEHGLSALSKDNVKHAVYKRERESDVSLAKKRKAYR